MTKFIRDPEFWVSALFTAALEILFYWVMNDYPKKQDASKAQLLFTYGAGLMPLAIYFYLHVSSGSIKQENSAPSERGESLHAPPVASSIQDEQLTKLLNKVDALRHDLTRRLDQLESSTSKAAPVAGVQASGDSETLNLAVKQIGQRDETIDRLTSIVSRGNVKMLLIRVAQSLENALSLGRRISNQQSNPAESFEFITGDLEAVLADQGVEFLVVSPGDKVTDLPAGSFSAISVTDAPSDELRGTIKEARSRAYFIKDEKGTRYIAPAKVILYKA